MTCLVLSYRIYLHLGYGYIQVACLMHITMLLFFYVFLNYVIDQVFEILEITEKLAMGVIAIHHNYCVIYFLKLFLDQICGYQWILTTQYNYVLHVFWQVFGPDHNFHAIESPTECLRQS